MNEAIDGQGHHETLVIVRVVAQQLQASRSNDEMRRSVAKMSPVQCPDVLHTNGGGLDFARGHQPFASRSIFRAMSKSFAVNPPAEWVLRDIVTLFQRMSMSGW